MNQKASTNARFHGSPDCERLRPPKFSHLVQDVARHAGATLLALYFVPAAHLMLARRARRKLPAATLTSTNRRENRPSEVDPVAAEHLQDVFLKGLTAQGSLGEASVLKEPK